MIYKPKPPMDLPPSTASELPVIMDASSLNSQLTAIATSSVVASLRSGICCFMISKASASHCSRASFVSTTVGRIVFTRIPYGPSSSA